MLYSIDVVAAGEGRCEGIEGVNSRVVPPPVVLGLLRTVLQTLGGSKTHTTECCLGSA